MDVRILDLDGSLLTQHRLLARTQPAILPLQGWGPSLRLACSHSAFARFEDDLTAQLRSAADSLPCLTFLGSGDFHHVSLALLRRQAAPCNLLLLDTHPDWVRAIPLLHCGTWLCHAGRLAPVQHIFHVGGDVDFDNHYRWLAPWKDLRSGRTVVFPACRSFRGRPWRRINPQPLRPQPDQQADRSRIEELLEPHRHELASHPLYVSFDKDVLTASEAVVNWDSGHLVWSEVKAVLQAFLAAAKGRLAAMDVVGDWSAVRVRGLLRRWLHWTEHPRLSIDPVETSCRNEQLNLRLLECLAPCIQTSGNQAGHPFHGPASARTGS